LIKERYPNVKVLAVKADVGKEADVRNAVDTAVKEFGRLDIMVSILQPIHPGE
jgi:NAD(P)-dependent dehydrogenase (short-subunit alcohol dehydrogenase family)